MLNEKQLDTLLKFVSVLGLLIFLCFIFSTISNLPIYQVNTILDHHTAMSESVLQLIKSFSDSMLKMFLSVVAFAAIVVVIVFRSNFQLNLNKDQVQIDVGLQEKDFTPGSGGMNKVVDEQGNIRLYDSEVYRQLTEDYIISEVKEDGRPAGYVTMESYLKGFKGLCQAGDCQTHNLISQDIKKNHIYAGDEYVQMGENIVSVAQKMINQKLSALPVVDKDGIMKGSINYLQVLSLLSKKAAKTKNR